MLFFDTNVQVGPIIGGQIPPLRGAGHHPGRDDSGVGNSSSMQNENILVGYFFQCLACKASFIRTTPESTSMLDTGDSILVKTRDEDREARIETVRCPDCLSQNVRLMEIGDRK